MTVDITINKKKFPVRLEEINVEDIAFHNDNIRINDKMKGSTTKENITQDQIKEILRKEESVENLKANLNNNSGNSDPIIVVEKKTNPEYKYFDCKYVVIEGNSRLCITKDLLHTTHKKDYKNIPSLVLMAELDHSHLRALQRIYHREGKTPWRAANVCKAMLEDVGGSTKIFQSDKKEDEDQIKKACEENEVKRDMLEKQCYLSEACDRVAHKFAEKRIPIKFEMINEMFSKKGLKEKGLYENTSLQDKIVDEIIIPSSGHEHRGYLQTLSNAPDKLFKKWHNDEIDLTELQSKMEGSGGKENIVKRTTDFVNLFKSAKYKKYIGDLEKRGVDVLKHDVGILKNTLPEILKLCDKRLKNIKSKKS